MIDIKQRKQVSNSRCGEAVKEFYLPRKAAAIVDGHLGLYDFAANHIGADTPITYLEFGVASGASMKAISKRFRHPSCSFVGFDSFLGLPEAWLMHERGAFSTDGRPPAIGDDRVEFVPGWFQNTVPSRLKSLGQPAAPVLIHYDADLYSSTSFLLSTMWHNLPDYYFMMDDFIHEDAAALYDFSRAYPVDVRFLAQTSGGGGNPDQVFGHIRRIRFSMSG